MKTRYYFLALGVTIAATGMADAGLNGEFIKACSTHAMAGLLFGIAAVIVLIGALKAREDAVNRTLRRDDFLRDRDDWGGV